MPRDNDKDNDSRGRRDRPSGGKGRSGRPRGPERKFAKRGFGGKSDGKNFDRKGDGDKRPYRGDREGRPPRRRDDDAPRRDFGDDRRPARFQRHRDERPRGDRPFAARPSRDGGDEKRAFKPRGDRPSRFRDDRAPRRDDARPAGRFQDRKFADKRPYTPRGDGFRKDGDRPRGDRPDRPASDGEKKFPRGPRKDFGGRRDKDFEARDRGDLKPWQKRSDRPRDEPRGDQPPRFSRSREDRKAGERPRSDRPRGDRPKFDRPRWDRKSDPGDRKSDPGDRKSDPGDRKSDPGDRRGDPEHRNDHRPRPEGRTDWQQHPRSEGRPSGRHGDRPRRDNEDETKIFAKRPAFGGRGAYRERTPDERRTAHPPREKKSGERIAKVVSRAGLASRRDAEEWIVQGRVTVNGRVINSPALDVTANDVITVDGKPLPPRERTRLFLYHKPRGLMTTHADPEGRPTVFDNLPEGLPRLISIGRLDFNTEGLLLLTNDGGLARVLELPDTGWLRRYRVRAHGEVTQAQLDELKKGIEVDGVKYGSIDTTLERDQGANVWLMFAIREGKNREVRNVMAHLGLEVNRLIRVSYGPFQLGELAEGEVEEVKTRVLREQLGEKVIAQAGADFSRPEQRDNADEEADAPRGKKPFKPSGRNALVADRKGRRVLVQRTGSEEARARNEAEANGYGPPRRPQRGYHGKRDLKPRDE